MSKTESNAYSNSGMLETNEGATAAAIDLLTHACAAGDETNKVNLLTWISDGDNLVTLRNKIKEAASD